MDEEQENQGTPKRKQILQDRTNCFGGVNSNLNLQGTIIKRPPPPPLDISMQSSFKKIKKDSIGCASPTNASSSSSSSSSSSQQK